MNGTTATGESQRAALLLAAFAALMCVASWRMVQLENMTLPARPAAAPARQPEAARPTQQPSPVVAAPAPQDRTAAIVDAAKRGDVSAVLDFVGQGVDINSAGSDRLTPLLAAIRNGSATPELIDRLLRLGADATAKDADGRDALGLAVEKDDINSIAALLKHSRKIARKAYDALCDAAAHNHIESLKFLLDNRLAIDHPDSRGRTALLAAIKYGSPETVRYLLDHDADPNKRGGGGAVPLEVAAARANTEILQALLDKSPNVNDRNAKGETAVLRAVRAHSADVVKLLITAGADVNQADMEGLTPLIAAVGDGRADLVRILLDSGADVKSRTADGATALSRAQGSDEISDMLRKAGATDDSASP